MSEEKKKPTPKTKQQQQKNPTKQQQQQKNKPKTKPNQKNTPKNQRKRTDNWPEATDGLGNWVLGALCGIKGKFLV